MQPGPETATQDETEPGHGQEEIGLSSQPGEQEVPVSVETSLSPPEL